MGLADQLLEAAGVEDDIEETTTTEGAAAVDEPAIETDAPAEVTPEATEEPAAEPTAEAPAETEPTQNRLAEYIRANYGEDFSGKYQSDAELLKGLVHAAKKIGERDEHAQLGRWIQERPAEALAWLQSQIQPQQPQQQQASDRPDYDPDWERQIETDEHGRAIGVKPGSDPNIAVKYNRALDYARRRQQELIFQPEKALEPLLSQARQQAVQEARQQWEQEFNARYGQQAVYQEAQQVLEGNKSWLFVEGNPGKGLTPAGRVYKETVDQWSQEVPNLSSRKLDELGRMAVHARFAQPAKPAAKPAKPGAVRTTNVQTQARAEQLKRKPGESVIDFFTRVDQQYNMIPED